MSEEIYKEIILENYKDPMNKGKIDNSDYHGHESNPVCGDELEIFIKENDGKIEDVKFDGHGCALSIASASLFTEHIKGKTVEELMNMSDKDILDILNIEIGATRIKCATLILLTIKKAFSQTE